MAARLKILISAYACEPGKGSEPEVGWQWALQAALFNDVCVLTRSNNQPAIEEALAALDPAVPRPKFFYFDAEDIVVRVKSHLKLTRLYYLWWQRAARVMVSRICVDEQIDVLHHVTFAGFRYTTAIWMHGRPSIWGPIGGMESIFWPLLPYRYPRSLLYELLRYANNLVQSAPISVLPERARLSNVVLSSTQETYDSFRSFGVETQLMPTVGIHPEEFTSALPRPFSGTLRLLFVGQFIWLKGIDLAVEALAEAGVDARLELIGSGPFEPQMKKLVRRFGLQDKVNFRGRLPRSLVMSEYPKHDVFLFPSLHDSGGFAVLEAMASGLPVICFDCGGPALAVRDGCGFRITPGKRSAVIQGLAAAIRHYAGHPADLARDGLQARESVCKNYDWEVKGREMNLLYQQVAAQPVAKNS